MSASGAASIVESECSAVTLNLRSANATRKVFLGGMWVNVYFVCAYIGSDSLDGDKAKYPTCTDARTVCILWKTNIKPLS